ncbi:hypothetical protein IV203_025473 [Nitzschia inconspicua]|uniref:Uncharacterized protein n=1 Tax=Nitzschia inconspicua TaxID=303405 RepID=A0A9K3PCB0_9STRA|nr:hypothetical protein IV203_028255 [Nitzschia inconspicua]KAG7362589.1 hypothetical protein IV203_025473 [Nitzschia inconspicua]
MDTLGEGEDSIFGIDDDPDDEELLAAYADMDAEDLETTIPALAAAASDCLLYLNSLLGTDDWFCKEEPTDLHAQHFSTGVLHHSYNYYSSIGR